MKLMFRPLALGLLIVSAASQLTACFPLAVGGAVMTGMVATDRRTSGTVVEDQAIELKAGSRIRDSLGDRVHINITSFNRQVLISWAIATSASAQATSSSPAALKRPY